ncbi:hypothetical protein [uncultured Shimia sp.]|uniref:hypothetical protein n=1 Tax=uncultured Shimia sp. TaxID=573152 RepID=UPI0026157872|nr:hypothetical protein [uncultured Shimia sp.]
MDDEAFESLEQLEAWLRKQDISAIQAFSARAALRELPALTYFSDKDAKDMLGVNLILYCLRATLTCGVSSTQSRKTQRAMKAAADASAADARSTVIAAATSSLILDSEAALRATRAARSISHAAATSAAISIRSASNSAISASSNSRLRDANVIAIQGTKAVYSRALWLEGKAGSESVRKWIEFLREPSSSRQWRFWHKWYQSMVEGKPLNWELQRRVALIEDDIWRAGPKAVAQAIHEIEQELAGPAPLEENVLRKHVEHLLKNPVISEATALNGAETLEHAISEYLRAAPANGLPEDLKHLEGLPQHFRAIARVIGSQTSKEEKEALLADEISKLHARVAELEKELAVAKSKELKGVISLKAAESFGKTIGSPVFWSGAAVSVGYFFGVTPSDMTLENFRNYVEELLRVNADTAPNVQTQLPSSFDI